MSAVGEIKWSIYMQISTFYRQEAKIKPLFSQIFSCITCNDVYSIICLLLWESLCVYSLDHLENVNLSHFQPVLM